MLSIKFKIIIFFFFNIMSVIVDIVNRKQYKLIEKLIIFVNFSKYFSINTNFVNLFFTFFIQILIKFIRS